MKPVYVFSSGRLARAHNTVVLETEEGKRYLPVVQVSEIYVFGEVDLNKRFLEFVTQKGILLHFFNRNGYYLGTYYPREHLSSGYLTLKQAEHYLDAMRRVVLARAFVQGSLTNLLKVLGYYARRGVDLEDRLGLIRTHLERLELVDAVPELMALEGNAREVYYGAWERILPEGFALRVRTKRPPRDPTNALVSFGNSLLYTAMLAQIYQTHLDPRIGYLHETNFRRHTLNLDVAEVFKPVLVDRLIFRLVNRGQLQNKHFVRGTEGVLLNEAGRRIFVQAWEETLQETYRHPSLRRSVSYRTTLRLELYKLEKHLIGDRPYAPFRLRW